MGKKRRVDDVVGEIREGDGVDPKEEKVAQRACDARGKPDYAVLRLANKIKDALNIFLPLCGTPGLEVFAVNSVEPSAKGTSFVVQVFSTDPSAQYEPREVKAALLAAKPALRAQVARETNRKNAPDFTFDILPARVLPK